MATASTALNTVPLTQQSPSYVPILVIHPPVVLWFIWSVSFISILADAALVASTVVLTVDPATESFVAVSPTGCRVRLRFYFFVK